MAIQSTCLVEQVLTTPIRVDPLNTFWSYHHLCCWFLQRVERSQIQHRWEWVFSRASWPDDQLLLFPIQDTSTRVKDRKFSLGSLLTWFEFSLSPVHLPDIASTCSQIQLLLDAADLQQHRRHLPEQTHCRAAQMICCYQMNPYLLFSPKPGETALESPQVQLSVPVMNLVGIAWWSVTWLNLHSVCFTHTEWELFPACSGSLVNPTVGWPQQG